MENMKDLIYRIKVNNKYNILWGVYNGCYIFCTNVEGYMRNTFISNAKTLELAFDEYKQELLECGFNV